MHTWGIFNVNMVKGFVNDNFYISAGQMIYVSFNRMNA